MLSDLRVARSRADDLSICAVPYSSQGLRGLPGVFTGRLYINTQRKLTLYLLNNLLFFLVPVRGSFRRNITHD